MTTDLLEPTELAALVVDDKSDARSQIAFSLKQFNEESKRTNYPFGATAVEYGGNCQNASVVAAWIAKEAEKNVSAKKPTVLMLDNAWDGKDEALLIKAESLKHEAIDKIPDDQCPGSVRLLRHLKSTPRPLDLPVLVWTAYDYPGWNDYLLKSLGVNNAVRKMQVGEQAGIVGRLVVGAYKRWLQLKTLETEWQRIVGFSAPTQQLRHRMRTVIESTTGNVLLVGDAGVGKSLVADILGKSLAAGRHMVKTNVTGLTESLIESELFGHKRHSFTGANNDKIGMFELANGGTVVFEEIGDLPLSSQAKVLIAVDSKLGGFIHPVGSNDEINVFVRVVSSTNRDIPAMVQRGQFREDLWQRLSYPHVITVPTLQERAEDFEDIANILLQESQLAEGRWYIEFDGPAMDLLKKEFLESARQSRQLGACIEKAMAIAGSEKTRLVTEAFVRSALDDLDPTIRRQPNDYLKDYTYDPSQPFDLWELYQEHLSEVEAWMTTTFGKVVKGCNGNATKARQFCSKDNDKSKQKLYERFARQRPSTET